MRATATVGLRKIRITGGEPLVRKNSVELVARLAAVPGIEDVAMTTNALLMSQYAEPLARAGLQRINVSLDTLKRERFAEITRGDKLDQAMEGILAAERAGMAPIKINAVVLRGINDDEIEDLARLTVEHPWHVRFIEAMPLGGNLAVEEKGFISADEILERLAGAGGIGRMLRPQRQRPRPLLPDPRGKGHHRGHQPHEPLLLLQLQPGAALRRR